MIIPTNAKNKSATLTTKSITSNGTYNASSDGADGYSSVNVDVYNPFEYIVKGLSHYAFQGITLQDGAIIRFRNLQTDYYGATMFLYKASCDDLTLKFDKPQASLANLFYGYYGSKVTLDFDTSLVRNFSYFLYQSRVNEVVGTIDFSSADNTTYWLHGMEPSRWGRLTMTFAPNKLASTQSTGTDVFTNETKISFANCLREDVENKSVVNAVFQNASNIRGNSVLDETETYHLFVQDDNGEMTLQDFVTNVKGWTIT